MDSRIGITLSVAIATMLLVNGALAQDEHPPVQPPHPNHKVPVNAAEQATDPSAILTQLGLFYWTGNQKNSDQTTDTFLFQPVLPMSKNNVLRPALPVIRSNGPTGKETAVGDLFVLDAFMFQIPNATWGIGPVASLPTASKDQFGSEKYELGVTAIYIYKGIPKNILGILGYNLWSVAGESSRQDVNKFEFQPIWVSHFKWGYIGWTDQTAVIDWENDDWSFPVGLRFGKVFKGKTPLNIAIEPYYTFNDVGGNEYGFRLGVTFVKPGWLNH
jgi:hypothetical protein